MKIIENLKKIPPKTIAVILIAFSLYFLINGITLFWRGYHNLDIAFNFLNLGYRADMSTNGTSIQLIEAYRNGLLQIRAGFGWICFTTITLFLSGFFVKKKNLN
jgi:hypothetical protein